MARPRNPGQLPPKSTKSARALVELYTRVDEQLQREILDAVAAGKQLTAVELRKRQARIQALLLQAEERAKPLVVQLLAESYRTGSAFMLRQIRKSPAARELKALDTAFGPRDRDAVTILVDNATQQIAETRIQVGRRTNDIFRQLALDSMAEGLAASEGRRELSDRLETALTRAGVTHTDGAMHLVQINGRNYRLGPYTEMVARTTPREAASHGMKMRMLANNLDLVIPWNETACDTCEPYIGKTFSLSGATEGYPVLDQLPPYHPRCECVLTPAPTIAA